MDGGLVFILMLIGGIAWLVKTALGTDQDGHDNSSWGKASRRDLTPENELDAAIRNAEIRAEERRRARREPARDRSGTSDRTEAGASTTAVGAVGAAALAARGTGSPGSEDSSVEEEQSFIDDEGYRPPWMRGRDDDPDAASEREDEVVGPEVDANAAEGEVVGPEERQDAEPGVEPIPFTIGAGEPEPFTIASAFTETSDADDAEADPADEPEDAAAAAAEDPAVDSEEAERADEAEADAPALGSVYTPTSVYTSSSFSLYPDGSAPAGDDTASER